MLIPVDGDNICFWSCWGEAGRSDVVISPSAALAVVAAHLPLSAISIFLLYRKSTYVIEFLVDF
jgi:hypothetical protein